MKTDLKQYVSADFLVGSYYLLIWKSLIYIRKCISSVVVITMPD